MKDKKRNIRFFIIMGLLFIAAALLLTTYNILHEMRANYVSSETLQKMDFGTGSMEYLQMPEKELPTISIRGVEYVGLLEVPDLRLQLPVASYWDENTAKVAPCRYMGSPYTGDLIVAGHNYRNHFGKLRRLQIGSEIKFMDVDGNTFLYKVAYMETVDGKDIAGMKNGSPTAKIQGVHEKSDWNLTLFTCDFSGRSRLAVRCVQQ